MECALCDALNQKFRLVYEDEYSFCIVCKFPLKEGHVMILPKRHVENLSDLNETESKSFTDMINKIKNSLEKTFNENIICFQNNRGHSTQKHIHFHLLPSKGNLRELISSYENVPARKDNSDEEKTRTRDKIISSFS